MHVRPVPSQLSEPVRKRLGLNAIADARVLLNDLSDAPELLTTIIKNLTTAKAFILNIADCAPDIAFIDAYTLYLYHYMSINNLSSAELPSTEKLIQDLQNLLPSPQQNNELNPPTLEILHQQIREANEAVDAVTLLRAVYQDAIARHLHAPYANIKSKLDNATNCDEVVTATQEMCQLVDDHTKSFGSNGTLSATMQHIVVSMYTETAKRLTQFAEQTELSLADGLTLIGLAKAILMRLNAIRPDDNIQAWENKHTHVYTSSALSQLSRRIDRCSSDITALAAVLNDLNKYRQFFAASMQGNCDSLESTVKIAMLYLYAAQIDDLRVMVSTNEAVSGDEISSLVAAYQIYMVESKSLYAQFPTATDRAVHADRLCEFLAFLLHLHITVSQSEYFSLFMSVMTYTQEQITSLIGEDVSLESQMSDEVIARVLPCLYVKTKCAYTMACATENFEEYNSLLDSVEKLITDYLSLIARSPSAAELNSTHHQAILRLRADLNQQPHPVRRLNKMLTKYANGIQAADRVGQLQEIIELYSGMAEVHQRLVSPPISLARLHAEIGDLHLTEHQAGNAAAMGAAIRCYKLAVLADKSDQATCEKLLAMLQAQLNSQRFTLLAISLRQDIGVFTAIRNSQRDSLSNQNGAATSAAATSVTTVSVFAQVQVDPTRQSTPQHHNSQSLFS